MLATSKRPLFWFGHGIRLAGAVHLIEPFLERFNVPFITSWQGKDMVRHNHQRFMGHAGVYGHRAANYAVKYADLIIAIGTRLALPQTGYDLSKFAPNAKLIMVDIDGEEIRKLRRCSSVPENAKTWMEKCMAEEAPYHAPTQWLIECEGMKAEMPWLESPLHDDANGYINSYRFIWRLNEWLKPDQVIVTDMGTALLCAYPMLKLNGNQRLITSTGLGEMGFGLSASIGVLLAVTLDEIQRPVLCLNCDGGMMFNLQELATIQHHKLPIKIIVFDNQGYNMIRRSQDALGVNHTASGQADLSFPDWNRLAGTFKMTYADIATWEDFDTIIPSMFGTAMQDKPMMAVVKMDPNQKFGPKTVYGQSLEIME